MTRDLRRTARDYLVAALTLGVPTRATAQRLETETARLPRAGTLEVGSAFEFQRSGDGRESAVPSAIEYGITNRLELLGEPVPSTAIRPKVGRRASGPGDLELTATYLVARARRHRPAFALAGEVKLPTARDELIGTRHTDYTGYLIASSRVGVVDVHANAGHMVLGQPPGAHLRNVLSGALAAEMPVRSRVVLFGEVLANTAAAPAAEGADAPAVSSGPGVLPTTPVPEAAGAELVGTLGTALRVLSAPRAQAFLSLGVSYDNNAAMQWRPGLTVWLP